MKIFKIIKKRQFNLGMVLFVGILFIAYASKGQSDSLNASLPQSGNPGLIQSERPGQTGSAFIVPAKMLQIETGFIFTNTQTKITNVNNWIYGSTLLRYGIWEDFELRIGSDFQQTNGNYAENGADTTENGFGPLTTGFKVRVAEEKGLRPQIAFVALITWRHIGSITYHPMFSFPTGRLIFAHHLTKNILFSYNAGFGYNGWNADGFFIYTIQLAYQITDRLSVFGEAFGNFDNDNLPNHRINGGLTWLLKNNLQFDVSAGKGFDKDIDKYFIQTGLSWRIPK